MVANRDGIDEIVERSSNRRTSVILAELVAMDERWDDHHDRGVEAGEFEVLFHREIPRNRVGFLSMHQIAAFANHRRNL